MSETFDFLNGDRHSREKNLRLFSDGHTGPVLAVYYVR